jgi:hypothetical protein
MNMKKAVLIFLACCAVMSFAISCVSSSFSGDINEVALETNTEGVLGNFDIEIRIPKHPGGFIFYSDDPEIIDAIKREIIKLGGTRAINVRIKGRETFGNIITRVIGTVVK